MTIMRFIFKNQLERGGLFRPVTPRIDAKNRSIGSANALYSLAYPWSAKPSAANAGFKMRV